jgi:hypothetical protein
MAVFKTVEQHDEVMAVYRMDSRVQENKCEQDWRRVDMDDGVVVRIYQGDDVKWYDSYEDVQGLQHLSAVLDQFAEERGFDYAWGYARIGEEQDDVEHDVCSNSDLIDVVYDNLGINRRIDLSL